MITPLDLRIALDAFLVLVAVEAVVKPIALRVGRLALKVADRYVGVVPDWLYLNRRD